MHSFLLSKLTFPIKSFRNTARVSNSLEPDQAQHVVGPDLAPNCLQRLSADNKRCHKRGKSESQKLTKPMIQSDQYSLSVCLSNKL